MSSARSSVERLDRVVEPGVAAEELRAGVPHFERRRRPLQGAGEIGKPVAVPAEHRALEPAADVVTAFEQMKLPVEIALALQVPLLIGKEDVVHAREVDP